MSVKPGPIKKDPYQDDADRLAGIDNLLTEEDKEALRHGLRYKLCYWWSVAMHGYRKEFDGGNKND